MKGKLIIVFVIAMLVLSSLACGGGGDGGTSPTPSSSQQEQSSDLVGVLQGLISSEAEHCEGPACTAVQAAGYGQK